MLEYLQKLQWDEAGEYVLYGSSPSDPKAFPRELPYGCGGTVFSSFSTAFAYLRACILDDLFLRVSPARAKTFCHRMNALASMYEYYGRSSVGIHDRIAAWNKKGGASRVSFEWSPKQREVLAQIGRDTGVADANFAEASRLFIDGPPGSGKSAVLVEAACRCADAGLHVLILCPTGTLVRKPINKT